MIATFTTWRAGSMLTTTDFEAYMWVEKPHDAAWQGLRWAMRTTLRRHFDLEAHAEQSWIWYEPWETWIGLYWRDDCEWWPYPNLLARLEAARNFHEL